MRNMMARLFRPVVMAVALSALALGGAAQERDRSTIPDKYKWNLADIYPDGAAGRAAKDRLSLAVPELGRFKGRLATSAATLADALEARSALDKDVSRLFTYASLLA